MQLRADHLEKSKDVLHKLIKDFPLGQFTTAISSANFPTIQVSHIPLVHDATAPSPSGHGVLRGHIARANPQWKVILETLTASGKDELDEEVCVIFTAPSHYITPKFYVETKPNGGKVVPTWNYAAVQVYGKFRTFLKEEGAMKGFLKSQVHEVSELCERGIMGYGEKEGKPEPWTVDEAPEKYTDLLIKAIAGFEIVIERLDGKFKMSQESPKADCDGIVEGLKREGGDGSGFVVGEVERRAAEKEERRRLKAEQK